MAKRPTLEAAEAAYARWVARLVRAANKVRAKWRSIFNSVSMTLDQGNAPQRAVGGCENSNQCCPCPSLRGWPTSLPG